MKKIMATVTMFFAMVGMVYMYFSGTFVPVYVNGQYILVNQLMRYALYVVLVVTIVYCFAYAISGPSKKHKKRPRRR